MSLVFIYLFVQCAYAITYALPMQVVTAWTFNLQNVAYTFAVDDDDLVTVVFLCLFLFSNKIPQLFGKRFFFQKISRIPSIDWFRVLVTFHSLIRTIHEVKDSHKRRTWAWKTKSNAYKFVEAREIKQMYFIAANTRTTYAFSYKTIQSTLSSFVYEFTKYVRLVNI